MRNDEEKGSMSCSHSTQNKNERQTLIEFILLTGSGKKVMLVDSKIIAYDYPNTFVCNQLTWEIQSK